MRGLTRAHRGMGTGYYVIEVFCRLDRVVKKLAWCYLNESRGFCKPPQQLRVVVPCYHSVLSFLARLSLVSNLVKYVQ